MVGTHFPLTQINVNKSGIEENAWIFSGFRQFLRKRIVVNKVLGMQVASACLGNKWVLQS